MKRILIFLWLVLALVSCDSGATAVAYNATSPARDMECIVNGTVKVVPGTSPYRASWDIHWLGDSWLGDSSSTQVSVRVREVGGSWSGPKGGTVVHGDTFHVYIKDSGNAGFYTWITTGE